jgi:hypothetical protein
VSGDGALMAKRRRWRGAGSRGGGAAAREAGAAGRREAVLEVGDDRRVGPTCL